MFGTRQQMLNELAMEQRYIAVLSLASTSPEALWLIFDWDTSCGWTEGGDAVPHLPEAQTFHHHFATAPGSWVCLEIPSWTEILRIC